MSGCDAYLNGEDPVAASQSNANAALRAIYLRASPFPHPELQAEADAAQQRFDGHKAQKKASCQINPLRRDAAGRFVGCNNVGQDLTNVPLVQHGDGQRRVRVAVFPPYIAPPRPARGYFDQMQSVQSYSSY